MARRPPAPANTRNGLKWREGRPRWEPSPASRGVGLKGFDLKDLDGAWIAERGLAMILCDDRQAWAQAVREAAQEGARGEDARAELRETLADLPTPHEPLQRLRRQSVQDLVDAARVAIAGADAAAGVDLAKGPRSVERLVDAYFAAGEAGTLEVKASTLRAYGYQRRAFLAKFAGRGVASIRRQELIAWKAELYEAEPSIATANLRLGAASAWLAYAHDLEWTGPSPATKLGIRKANGRRVFWTLEEERDFTSWCDANGYADVADAVIAGLWTGARIIDLCAANLEDLAGPTWRYLPIKTDKTLREAMPAVLPQVRVRIDRRAAEAAAELVRHLNTTPFLYDRENLRRHDVRTMWKRFCKAKAECLAQGAAPETLADKKQQDTRDTCITRLWLAKVAPSRMWSWTGHSQKGIEAILKDHYLVLVEAGQVEMGAELLAWAQREALSL